MNAPPLPSVDMNPLGLLPGAPELYPGVSGSRTRLARETITACRELAERVVAMGPARLLVVSHHATRRGGMFGLPREGRLVGDLGRQGAPEVVVDLPVDTDLAARVHTAAAQSSVLTWERPGELDARTTAALAFFTQAGWRGPTTVLSLPLATGSHELAACGGAIGASSRDLGGRAAGLVVGEGCRRIRHGSPEDYHPEAILFDRHAGRALLDGRAEDLISIDRGLRELAVETIVDASELLLAALGGPPHGTRLSSYENALGVGHLVAMLHDDGT